MGAALLLLVRLFWILGKILVLLFDMLAYEWERFKRKTRSYNDPRLTLRPQLGSKRNSLALE